VVEEGMNPHLVTQQFEEALCAYTGTKYAVAVNSCTSALELALLVLRWKFAEHWKRVGRVPIVSIPKHTYVSVPQAVIRAGFQVEYDSREWAGAYLLKPFNVVDSAKRFTSGMHVPGQFQCVSFHVAKIFGDTQGGAILHDSVQADRFFRLARFDGRRTDCKLSEDRITLPAEFTRHCYMSPDVAVRLLNHMQYLPRDNPDQEEVYADISYIR